MGGVQALEPVQGNAWEPSRPNFVGSPAYGVSLWPSDLVTLLSFKRYRDLKTGSSGPVNCKIKILKVPNGSISGRPMRYC